MSGERRSPCRRGGQLRGIPLSLRNPLASGKVCGGSKHARQLKRCLCALSRSVCDCAVCVCVYGGGGMTPGPLHNCSWMPRWQTPHLRPDWPSSLLLGSCWVTGVYGRTSARCLRSGASASAPYSSPPPRHFPPSLCPMCVYSHPALCDRQRLVWSGTPQPQV